MQINNLYFFLIKLGVHIGHSKIDWNPKLSIYMSGMTNNTYLIFNINKTIFYLKRSLLFMKLLGFNNGKFLIYYPGDYELFKHNIEGVFDKEGFVPMSYPFIHSLVKPGFFSNWKVNYKKLVKMFFKIIFYNPYFFASIILKLEQDLLTSFLNSNLDNDSLFNRYYILKRKIKSLFKSDYENKKLKYVYFNYMYKNRLPTLLLYLKSKYNNNLLLNKKMTYHYKIQFFKTLEIMKKLKDYKRKKEKKKKVKSLIFFLNFISKLQKLIKYISKFYYCYTYILNKYHGNKYTLLYFTNSLNNILYFINIYIKLINLIRYNNFNTKLLYFTAQNMKMMNQIYYKKFRFFYYYSIGFLSNRNQKVLDRIRLKKRKKKRLKISKVIRKLNSSVDNLNNLKNELKELFKNLNIYAKSFFKFKLLNSNYNNSNGLLSYYKEHKKAYKLNSLFEKLNDSKLYIKKINNSILSNLHKRLFNKIKTNKIKNSKRILLQSFKICYYNLYNILVMTTLRRKYYKNKAQKLTPKEHFFLKRFFRFLLLFRYLKRIQTIPQAIILLNPSLHEVQKTDFSNLKTTIISLVDSNSQLSNLSYFVPSNDDSIITNLFYLKLLINSFELGKKEYYITNYINYIPKSFKFELPLNSNIIKKKIDSKLLKPNYDTYIPIKYSKMRINYRNYKTNKKLLHNQILDLKFSNFSKIEKLTELNKLMNKYKKELIITPYHFQKMSSYIQTSSILDKLLYKYRTNTTRYFNNIYFNIDSSKINELKAKQKKIERIKFLRIKAQIKATKLKRIEKKRKIFMKKIKNKLIVYKDLFFFIINNKKKYKSIYVKLIKYLNINQLEKYKRNINLLIKKIYVFFEEKLSKKIISILLSKLKQENNNSKIRSNQKSNKFANYLKENNSSNVKFNLKHYKLDNKFKLNNMKNEIKEKTNFLKFRNEINNK